jgi:glycosyltransferase involved in cell wall biosynthesis
VRPKVVYLADPGDESFGDGVRARARAAGTRILELRDGGRFDPCCIARLRRIARRADVVHAHDYKTDVYGLLLGERARLVATAHGWTRESLKVRLYEKVDLTALRFYDRVIAVSNATRATLLAGGVSPGRITLLRNGIDERAWRPENEAGDLRDELGLTERDLVVGTVTRLSHEKGVDLFLDMAARVDAHVCSRLGGVFGGEPARRPTFVILGGGPEESALRERAERLGIARRVRFLGDRRDVLRALNTFTVFVLASRVENAPNALLEAMSCGKPCAAFDAGGVSETLGEAGLLAPPRDTARLADSVLALLSDARLRGSLGAIARERIVREFSFARRLRRIESIYEEVCFERALAREASGGLRGAA